MSWSSKVGLFLVATLVSAQVFAQKISFGGAGNEANLETKVLRSESSLAPVILHLTVPNIDVEKQSDGFDSLKAPGLVPMDAYGNPDLFTTGSLIAVPEGYQARLTVLSSEQRDLPGVLVRPAQKQYRCGGTNEDFKFNATLYQSKGLFPRTNLSLEEVGRLRGLHLERVAFYPLQLDPTAKVLKVTTDAKVRVDFVRTSEKVAPLHLSEGFYRLARAVTSNGLSLGRDVLQADSADLLLILTADSLQESLAPLVAWKRQKGIETRVVTFSEAGGSKEEVKAYIQNLYNTSAQKPTYLLFVGNKSTMPPYFEETGSGKAATDYTFALLGGGNVPNIFYGRLPADNAEDVKVQINRWIEYEKTPNVGADWYAKATTIASSDGASLSDKEYAQEIAKTLKANTFKDVDGFYQGDQSATISNITDALKEGRSWISYFGHGSGTSWGSTNESFDVGTVGHLTNDHLPVIVDVACENAAYTTHEKCFGKAWVTQQSDGKNVGAVAFLGGSVNVSWHPPAIMSVGIAHYHFEKPVYSLGGSVLAGQLYLIEKKGNTSETIDNVKWYNLFGDPSLEMRTALPMAYTVKMETKRHDNSITVMLRAEGQDGQPVKGLLASLSNESKSTPLAVAHTTAAGEASLTVDGVAELEANTLLTTTGYNAETHQVDVQ
jgi:hypothetical protein